MMQGIPKVAERAEFREEPFALGARSHRQLFVALEHLDELTRRVERIDEGFGIEATQAQVRGRIVFAARSLKE